MGVKGQNSKYVYTYVFKKKSLVCSFYECLSRINRMWKQF